MLYEFICANYRSIREPVKFSLLATPDDRYEEFVYNNGKERFLRVASIYGANGSGKTTFLDAIGFVKGLVEMSNSFQPGDRIKCPTHKLSPNERSIFTMQFEKNGSKYAFGFSLKSGKVVDEYLYYFPNGKRKKIYERSNLDLQVNNAFKKDFLLASQAIKDNKLFFSVAANFSQNPEVENAFLFIKEDIVFYTTDNNWRLYSFRQYLENEKIYKRTVDFLQYLRTDIQGFTPLMEEHPIELGHIPPELIKKMDSVDAYREIEFDATIDYGIFTVDLREESTGIVKLLSIIGPIFDVLDTNKILIFDEIETGLHERIARAIIETFLKQKGERRPQLIFTTHDTSLLDAGLFRRDQIWFTQIKGEDRSTQLYSLAELKNVRKIENLKNGYISGKYGAVPMLQPEFEKTFSY